MNYAVAIISGLLFGITVGAAKHLLIWRPYARGRGDKMYGRMTISTAINVLALFTVFLLRGYWPYSFNFTIIAVAVGLSFTTQLLSYREKKKAASSADE